MKRYDIVKRLQDYRSIDWSERASSSGTAGTYLKARTGSGTRAIYLKLSRYNGIRIDGNECINEVVASRLLEILGFEHLAYRLIHARVTIDGREHETWLNTSKNFRRPGEQKMGLGAFFGLYHKDGEDPWEFCRRMGWERHLRRIILVDYLITNRDRHASNIEVIIAPNGEARLAPIFDNGLSLLAPYGDDWERIESFDPLAEVATTNFIGSRSLSENLITAIESGKIEVNRPLVAQDRELLLSGLDAAAPFVLLDKIWEIIWTRWCHYEAL